MIKNMFQRKGKEIKRRIFGFPCDTTLQVSLKMLAQEMHVPIYAVMEHICQLGAGGVAAALGDEKARKDLEEHILREHLLVPGIDAQNEYDLLTIMEARWLEKNRGEFEDVTGEFIKICNIEDIAPWFLLELARSMLKNLRERRRRKDDIPTRREKPDDFMGIQEKIQEGGQNEDATGPTPITG